MNDIDNYAKDSNTRRSGVTQYRIIKLMQKRFKATGSSKIRSGELAKTLEVDKNTITRNCKELKKDGLIKKKNKQAEYELTPLAGEEATLFRRIYKTRILKKIWEIKPSLVHYKTDGKRLKATKFLDVDDNISSSKITTQKEKDEIELFIFGNKIGAIIIHLFIQAIKPYLHNLELSKKSKYQLLENLEGKDKDDSIEKWIKLVIKPVDIFKEFCKLSIVNRGQSVRTSNSNLSNYEIDDENFDKLEKLFQEVFPLIHEKLEEHKDRQERESKASIEYYSKYKASERKAIRHKNS